MNQLSDDEIKLAHRNTLLASIAIARGMEWNNTELVESTTQEVIANEPNAIAKKLLGLMTSPTDIETVESILNVITRVPDYENLVQHARATLEKDGVILPESAKLITLKTGTPEWFRKMMGLFA